MNVKKYVYGLWLIAITVCCMPGASDALLIDKENGVWNLIGKAKTQATFRTTDTPDNNSVPFEAGDMISQRNLLMVEFTNNLGNMTPWLSVDYYLQGRAFYDGAWDYGPDIMSDDDTRAEYLFDNRDQIDDLKKDVDLFMGYVDLTSGPLFMRIGRQIMAWGEMSTKRILDGTNPMDTSSLSVDMLERLVPLDMVRSNYTVSEVGMFSSVSLEGYFVPGHIEDTNGEELIDGSPVQPPIGRDTIEDLNDPLSLASLKQVIDICDDDIVDDRYGIKLGMMIGDLEFNIAHYRMYSDIPVPRLDPDMLDPIYLTLTSIDLDNLFQSILGDQKLTVILDIDKVDVYGSSFNYYCEPIDTVIRGEFAIFKDVPKITPGHLSEVVEAFAPKITIEGLGTLQDLLDSGLDLSAFDTMDLPFTAGKIATYDVWKYGIGIDKNIVTPLNPEKEIIVMLEYVGSKIIDYEKHTIVYPWQGPHGETLYEPEYTHDFILIAQTDYLKGLLTPRITAMYETVPEAIILIQSITITKGACQFEASYFYTATDTYEQEGFLESRDELTFSFTYNF